MGHVDAGKTKLLDCIRGTNVQENEAGGITQQIGATYFLAEKLKDRTRELKPDAKLKVPGLLIIDTLGHESFINLHSRGSGLCDIAILVVDVMDGVKPQTVESLTLLKMWKTSFIVASNKVTWSAFYLSTFVKAKNQQCKDEIEFNRRLTEEQGWNSDLYYKIKNNDMGEAISIVPRSAMRTSKADFYSQGIPDMLLLLCRLLEVKVNDDDKTTIDVVLIVVHGMQRPIVTTIRALSTPHPMKELRVKVKLSFDNSFTHNHVAHDVVIFATKLNQNMLFKKTAKQEGNSCKEKDIVIVEDNALTVHETMLKVFLTYLKLHNYISWCLLLN
ncbi:hypothetical protein DCAR_0311679 [Daucus carota subsp. sativus]|uniref:Tr-type G domain-containing protein n=1 Tax=Daucus carota subsp. sativus TaxID=79200 RepID=A0AAF1ARD7_DAUCS|nr:hypothetical protein DCAR_0311679 [Daucus carota subsp. sativus]